jgi:hypothetical protein
MTSHASGSASGNQCANDGVGRYGQSWSSNRLLGAIAPAWMTSAS